MIWVASISKNIAEQNMTRLERDRERILSSQYVCLFLYFRRRMIILRKPSLYLTWRLFSNEVDSISRSIEQKEGISFHIFALYTHSYKTKKNGVENGYIPIHVQVLTLCCSPSPKTIATPLYFGANIFSHALCRILRGKVGLLRRSISLFVDAIWGGTTLCKITFDWLNLLRARRSTQI